MGELIVRLDRTEDQYKLGNFSYKGSEEISSKLSITSMLLRMPQAGAAS